MPTPRVCPTPGCPTLTPGGRCPTHRTQARRARTQDPDVYAYNTAAHRRFRTTVLARQPNCALCGARATVADHYPTDRRTLIATGQNPDNPNAGRGLCARCHNRHTARTSPGGFANPT